MKKIVMIAMSALMAVPALAMDGVVDSNAQIIEQEQGAMNPADLEAMGDETTFFRSNDGAAIVGGIVGGIIGAIAADRWDRDNYRPGRPGRPGRDRWVTCFAQNRRGQTFRATARRARVAQDQAMRKCYDYSRACRPLGCR